MHIAYLPSGIFQAYTLSGTVYFKIICAFNVKFLRTNTILEFRFTENKFIFYFILSY